MTDDRDVAKFRWDRRGRGEGTVSVTTTWKLTSVLSVVCCGPAEPKYRSLRMLDLGTVNDCPEDSVYHILYLFINLIHTKFCDKERTS